MKQVETPDELKDELKKALKSFMENNQQFNIQGEFTGENGKTVNALVDFGIEDRDHGLYYVGSVSANMRNENNLKVLDEKGLISEDKPVDEVENRELFEEFGESDIFIEVENKMLQAIREVFQVSRRRISGEVDVSDVDVHSTIPISYGTWKTREEINSPKPANREVELV